MKPMKPSHKRLPKFEAFDRIGIDVVPRFKESDMSGDEWRTSVHVRFFFKGVVVHEWTSRDMETAILMLGHEWIAAQEPIPDRVLEIEKKKCDQPGCPKLSLPKLRVIRQQFSSQGEKLDPSDCYSSYYRRFCREHSDRGDCSREDQDSNYTAES